MEDHVEDSMSFVTPVRPLKRHTDRFSVREDRKKIVSELQPDQVNAVLLTTYESAYDKAKRADRQNLSESEKQDVMFSVQRLPGCESLTWDALKMRISRMRDRGQTERKEGSGRKQIWTPEMADLAKTISREHNYEISRTDIYYEMVSRWTSAGAKRPPLQRARVLWWLAVTFKRRRLRYKPRLTQSHMDARLEYCNFNISNNFKEEEYTIFLDEKIFKSMTMSVLNVPHEDVTPVKYVQSKTNPPQIMVLVALMRPRGTWNGVVGSHFFVESVAAVKSSANRPAGTMELKAINITKETYVAAVVDSIFPALLALIEKGVLPRDVEFVFQDDNATPHRGLFAKTGVDVSRLFCMKAKMLGLNLRVKTPSQPAQSPDLNPLDTFLFRVLAHRFRVLRAKDQVAFITANKERTVGDRIEEDGDIESSDSDQDGIVAMVEEEEGDDFVIHKRVPLSCVAVQHGKKLARCGGCRQPVRERDVDAVQCDLRNGWICISSLVGSNMYPRAVLPEPGDDVAWICPRCSMHLCKNDDRSRHLCVACHQPSTRSGFGEMGGDMVQCDSDCNGLFHKKCVNYENGEDLEAWYCLACDGLIDDEYDPVESFEERPISANNLDGLKGGVEAALAALDVDTCLRGFETRQEFMRKIVQVQGRNDYELHWRHKSERDNK